MSPARSAFGANSAFTNIRSPYSAANSFRNGLSSIVPFQASSYASAPAWPRSRMSPPRRRIHRACRSCAARWPASPASPCEYTPPHAQGTPRGPQHSPSPPSAARSAHASSSFTAARSGRSYFISENFIAELLCPSFVMVFNSIPHFSPAWNIQNCASVAARCARSLIGQTTLSAYLK